MSNRILPFFSSSLSRKGAIATALLVMSVMASDYAGLRSDAKDGLLFKGSVKDLAVSAPPQTPGDRLDAELITLQPSGFEPSEITSPRGAFLLAVDNRSGLEEIELRF